MDSHLSNDLIDKIKERATSANTSWLATSYVCSYPSLLLFFKENKISVETLIQGSHLVYGWMPTILEIRDVNGINMPDKKFLEANLKIINELQNRLPTENELESLVRITNNSTIGLSKLLHFAFPDRFPIWDTEISRTLKGPTYWSGVNKISNYQTYLKLMNSQEAKELSVEIQPIILNSLRSMSQFYDSQDSLPPLRALEMTMFKLGSSVD